MNGTRRALGVAASTLLLFGASCDGDVGPRPGPGASPTSSATPIGDFSSGEAQIEFSRDINERYTLPLDATTAAVYQPPDGALIVVWADAQGRSFAMSGQVFTGARPTATDFTVTLTTTDITLFLSLEGECTVAIRQADEGGIAGTLRCKKLEAGGQEVNVTGTFSAQT